MISNYQPQNAQDRRNVIKEVMQEIILYGLSQANFFKSAAFYGGTALRIFHGLDRFSEDLDFSLLSIQNDFDIGLFLPKLQSAVESFGIRVEVSLKEKSNDSTIKSAFLKGETISYFLLFYPDAKIQGINKEEKIKIKLEVDVNPPKHASYETKYCLLPFPYEIRIFDLPSLLAGKIHAILCRTWKHRIKGRDLYDFVFFITNRVPVNLPHAKELLLQTQFPHIDRLSTVEDIKRVLIDKFHEIDFTSAKKDVLPFIKGIEMLDIWCESFFISITNRLTAVSF